MLSHRSPSFSAFSSPSRSYLISLRGQCCCFPGNRLCVYVSSRFPIGDGRALMIPSNAGLLILENQVWVGSWRWTVEFNRAIREIRGDATSPEFRAAVLSSIILVCIEQHEPSFPTGGPVLKYHPRGWAIIDRFTRWARGIPRNGLKERSVAASRWLGGCVGLSASITETLLSLSLWRCSDCAAVHTARLFGRTRHKKIWWKFPLEVFSLPSWEMAAGSIE